MLHVQRGPDVDAGRQQFLDVLPALGVAGTGCVRVRQFIHQDQAGPSGQRAVQVEFLQHMAAVRHVFQRQDRQAFQQAGGFAAAMGFDDSGQHADPLRGLRPGRDQHGVGLAHAGR
ncbi:hypothetical protein G6F22_020364 [Rhizopus arrhizus]|nr:hypothetical protein G6F22_020364 [Rhizopus arrhizus]